MADEVVKDSGKAKKKDKKERKEKKSWFKGLKTEFKKIMWTDKKTLGKQAIAVIVVSVLFCVLITLVDSVALAAIEFIIG
ncbi:MAG TPA: preprotein translocase subunit SecE [Candidatus Scatomonas pullistercoris]|uniref:Preprotein translocase subunit SecE n=1 Tax=Candidatus Scatomonas pullistercoris TaxID=2840920 RepID=A0A9D1P4Z7_9FIRM|nr:preprotein translocase subunit SecE [Candidatus Scatomonas pullistercoris]